MAPLPSQAGIYTGEIRRVQLYRERKDLDFELILCWITQPDQTTAKFDYSTPGAVKAPFSIDVASTENQLEVVLTAYTINDLAKCGPVAYSAKTSSSADPSFDAFASGVATITDNKIVFRELNVSGRYPLGTLTVTVTVTHSASTTPVYQVSFTIAVVDCLKEPFTVSGASVLAGVEHEFRFPTFYKQVIFPEVLTFVNSDA